MIRRAAIAIASTCAACHGGAASAPDAALADAPAGPPPFVTYTIDVGAHDAFLAGRSSVDPIDGLSHVIGRDYQFVLDPSAEYVLTAPVQPDDQLDWNKLPGISDCGQLDLAVAGVMFGWRWRVDLEPPVLELTAYANDASTHEWPTDALVTLDDADLASLTPLRYQLWADGALYRYAITGTMRGRAIDVSSTLTRGCPTTDLTSESNVQWAAGFYFGGTSTAPSVITGEISEQAFTAP